MWPSGCHAQVGTAEVVDKGVFCVLGVGDDERGSKEGQSEGSTVGHGVEKESRDEVRR